MSCGTANLHWRTSASQNRKFHNITKEDRHFLERFRINRLPKFQFLCYLPRIAGFHTLIQNLWSLEKNLFLIRIFRKVFT